MLLKIILLCGEQIEGVKSESSVTRKEAFVEVWPREGGGLGYHGCAGEGTNEGWL